MYIDIKSNHAPSTKKQIPVSISKRTSKLSSIEEVFNNNIGTYLDSLKRCEFQDKPVFIPETPSDPHANKRLKRRRKIIWFNPPYSMNVKTNIGKVFLNLIIAIVEAIAIVICKTNALQQTLFTKQMCPTIWITKRGFI